MIEEYFIYRLNMKCWNILTYVLNRLKYFPQPPDCISRGGRECLQQMFSCWVHSTPQMSTSWWRLVKSRANFVAKGNMLNVQDTTANGNDSFHVMVCSKLSCHVIYIKMCTYWILQGATLILLWKKLSGEILHSWGKQSTHVRLADDESFKIDYA